MLPLGDGGICMLHHICKSLCACSMHTLSHPVAKEDQDHSTALALLILPDPLDDDICMWLQICMSPFSDNTEFTKLERLITSRL
jgi:hypothetical protein